MVTYRNFYPNEGTLDGTTTISFSVPIKRIQITNDSGAGDLSFKLNSSETFGTVKPMETVSLDVAVTDVLLSTDTIVSYRVWGLG